MNIDEHLILLQQINHLRGLRITFLMLSSSWLTSLHFATERLESTPQNLVSLKQPFVFAAFGLDSNEVQ